MDNSVTVALSVSTPQGTFNVRKALGGNGYNVVAPNGITVALNVRDKRAAERLIRRTVSAPVAPEEASV